MADLTDVASGLVVGLVVLLVGGAVAAGGGYLYQDAKQATATAVEVDGTVVSSEVVHTTVDGGKAGGSQDAYYPRIQYRYTYEGETFSSTNLCPGAGSGCGPAQNKADRSEVEDFLAQYPEGGTATVHVPPDDPSGAYLVSASSKSTSEYLILVGFGGLIGLLGLAIFVSNLRDLLAD